MICDVKLFNGSCQTFCNLDFPLWLGMNFWYDVNSMLFFFPNCRLLFRSWNVCIRFPACLLFNLTCFCEQNHCQIFLLTFVNVFSLFLNLRMFLLQAAICRCSQPLSGFRARCLEDEQMLHCILKSNPNPKSEFMYVVDTRPKVRLQYRGSNLCFKKTSILSSGVW